MTSIVAWRINAALVIAGLVWAVLPALAAHVVAAIFLIAVKPALWLAYGIGWWALIGLLRIFASFFSESVRIGPTTIIGLAAGSVTVVIVVWSAYAALTACHACNPPPLLGYRPTLFCIGVAAHWAVLHHWGFRLIRPPGRRAEAAPEIRR